jgi:hypothetical protein
MKTITQATFVLAFFILLYWIHNLQWIIMYRICFKRE